MAGAMRIVFTAIAGAAAILAVLPLPVRHKRVFRRMATALFVQCFGALIEIALRTPQFGRRTQTARSTNIAEKRPTPEFPELKTRFYDAPPERVLDEADAALCILPNWKVVSADRAAAPPRLRRGYGCSLTT